MEVFVRGDGLRKEWSIVEMKVSIYLLSHGRKSTNKN